MGRPVLSRRVTTCGQWCDKVWLILNVYTQAQSGVYLSIYIYLEYPVGGNNAQGSDPFASCMYTWVIPPIFFKAALATICIRKIFRLKVKKTLIFKKYVI